METILKGTYPMLVMIVLACLLVLMAMLIDLGAGLYKAKQRGEVRSSWGLKRSLTKFITYEGGLLIAAGVDIMMHLCKFMSVIGVDALVGVPVITCLVAIFLMIVEFFSVREKADEKTRTEFARVEKLAASMVSREELTEAITNAIKAAITKDKGGE